MITGQEYPTLRHHFLKRHYNGNQEIFHTVKAPATCHLAISTTFAQVGFLEKLHCLK